MADTTKGFVSLLRDIQGHWLWRRSKPFSWALAWIDMLLMANHKDNKLYFEGNIITVERGSFITSQFKLADRWGWSRKKVRLFLELLKNPKTEVAMIVCQNQSNRATKIIICKYNELQEVRAKSRANEGPTEGQPRAINNNDNNDNNDNKDNIMSGKPDFSAPILYLNKRANRNFDVKNKGNLNLVKARFNEGRTLDQFKKVIDKKVAQWLTDDKMMGFLRPSTLFNRTKFENYLNEPVGQAKKQQTRDDTYKAPKPVNEEERKRVADLVHKTAVKM